MMVALTGDPARGTAPHKIGNDVSYSQLFGDIWCRPQLSMFERSLAVNAALIALGKEQELGGVHTAGLLNCGFTEQQYEEMCMHLAHYSGWPTSVGGRRALAQAPKSWASKM